MNEMITAKIKSFSDGQRKYEEKKAQKNGFDSLNDYLFSKIKNKKDDTKSLLSNKFPTQKQIDDKITELKVDHQTQKYQRDRATSYPSIQEQLDMQYWDAVNGTKKWQEAVAKVKADNPKPE